MNKNSPVNQKSNNHFFIVISALIMLIGVLSVVLYKNALTIERLESTRFKLYALGRELRQSSEDLTKYCRLYVITGDFVWEQMYNEVLDIRNGMKPRTNGSKIALRDSLLKIGIKNSEYDKLIESENESNKLVWTELLAFNAMKGLYPDEKKEFTVLAMPDTLYAMRILFDANYHESKERIMRPIREFRSMLNDRIVASLKKQKRKNNILLASIVILIVIILIISFYVIVVLRKKIVKYIIDIKKSNEKLKERELSLINKNETITNLHNDLKVKNADLIKLNSAKDKFFSIIAHDLRNPITSLLQLSELLREQYDSYTDSEIKGVINILYNSANNTQKLLDGLLSWAMLQSGKLEPKFKKLKPSEIIADVKLLFEPMAIDKNITIEIDIQSDDFIYADDEMFVTVLRNLINNAIKYTEIGGKIIVSVLQSEANILFKVKDTGIGIDENEIDAIFEIRNQVSKRGTSGEKGTGLGLILCKEFVSMNKGNIWVKSELGFGSEFVFSVPKYIL